MYNTFIIPPDYYSNTFDSFLSIGILFLILSGIGWAFKIERLKKIFSGRYYAIVIGTIFLAHTIALLVSQQDLKIKSTSSSWNIDEETYLYQGMKQTIKPLNMQPDQEEAFLQCMLDKYKSQYPEGLSKVSEEEGKVFGRTAGQACMEQLNPVDSLIESGPVDSLMEY